jgi:hypothetical protein
MQRGRCTKKNRTTKEGGRTMAAQWGGIAARN